MTKTEDQSLPNPSSPKTYNFLARQFHWIIAILLISMFALGWTMTDLPLSKIKLDFYAWHKWLGIVILSLALLRLTWRLLSKTPASSNTPSIPGYMNKAAKLGHLALYLLLMAVPLIGWLRSSTAGFQVVLFEKIPLPDLLGKDEALSKQFAELHEILAITLLAVIIGHIAAVILHHMRFKDPVLERMKPDLWHRALLVIALLSGAAFFINYTIINPPAKTELPAGKPAAIKADSKSENVQSTVKMAQASWIVDKTVSKLEFVATQKSAPTIGEFRNYEIKKLTFDPQNLSTSEVEIEIETASISVSNTLVEQTLKSSSWFNADEFPNAIFKAQNFVLLSADIYKLNGGLTIKDITKSVSLTLKIKTTHTTGDKHQTLTAEGTVTISRLDYQIGQGEWASTETLNEEVILKIKLTAINNTQ